MTVKKISASISIKKQLERYEPVDVFVGAEAEVTGEEDLVLAQKGLFGIVKQAATDELDLIIKDYLEKEKKREDHFE